MSRAHAAADLVRAQARPLKMPGLARAFEGLARKAREGGWTHEECLYEVLGAELTSRADSAVTQAARRTFSGAKAARQLRLRRGRRHRCEARSRARAQRVDRARRKRAARGTDRHRQDAPRDRARHRGRAPAPARRLLARGRPRAHADRGARCTRAFAPAAPTGTAASADRRRTRLFIPFDRASGELLFNLLAARYEKGSVIVTTNLAFIEWPQVFAGDEKLATALIDRLADRGTIITTEGKSFRLQRRRREPKAAAGSPPAEMAEG